MRRKEKRERKGMGMAKIIPLLLAKDEDGDQKEQKVDDCGQKETQ